MTPVTVQSGAIIYDNLVKWPVETRTETFQNVAFNSTLKDSTGSVGNPGDFLTSVGSNLLWQYRAQPVQTLLLTKFINYTNQTVNTPIQLTGIPANSVQMTVTLFGGGGMSSQIPNIAVTDQYPVSIFGSGGSGAMQVYSSIPVNTASTYFYQFNTSTTAGTGMDMVFKNGVNQTIGSAGGGQRSQATGNSIGQPLPGGAGGITTNNGIYFSNNYVGTPGQAGSVFAAPNITTTYVGPQPVQNSFQIQGGAGYGGAVCTSGSYVTVVVQYNGTFAAPTIQSYATSQPQPAGILFQIYGIL
jgi:hypothetical protein